LYFGECQPPGMTLTTDFKSRIGHFTISYQT
jgi:hypothetical protein